MNYWFPAADLTSSNGGKASTAVVATKGAPQFQ